MAGSSSITVHAWMDLWGSLSGPVPAFSACQLMAASRNATSAALKFARRWSWRTPARLFNSAAAPASPEYELSYDAARQINSGLFTRVRPVV